MKKKICESLITAALIALFLTSCSNRAAKLTAFTNVNLVPMTGEKIIENQTVLVEGTKIAAIADSVALRIPEFMDISQVTLARELGE